MRHRDRWWLVVVVGAVVATAEWLRTPSTAWAVTAALAAVAAAALQWRGGRLRLLLAGTLLLLAAALLLTAHRLSLIATDWPAQREARITAYGERVGGELRSALRSASRLAERAVLAAPLDRDRAFEALRGDVPAHGVELGVVVLDSSGAPYAWAGRHRLTPQALGDSIDARASGYYVVLETRRHSGARTVVASVLIWADSAVADRGRSVAERFRRATEVGLRVYAPGAAPEHNPDIFDYAEPTTAGPRLLFSVQPVPPTQDEARARAFIRGGRTILVLVLAVTLLAVITAAGATARYAVLIGPLWLAVRAPVGDLLGMSRLFSPATFFDPLLGPLSASPVALGLSGALATTLALTLWRRGDRRLVRHSALPVIGAAVAMLALWRFGQGVTPPVTDAGLPLWLLWQGTLVLAGAPFAIVAAALERAPDENAPRWPIVGALLTAVVLALGYLVSWTPGHAPGLVFPLLMALPIALAARSGPRPVTLVAMAAILGMMASLLVWRADAVSRQALASADVARLGDAADPFMMPLLDRFAVRVGRAPPPATAAELYTVWQGSALESNGYPVQLALWDSAGRPVATLPLDSLAISQDLLGAMARGVPDSVGARELQAVQATPGVHEVLAMRVTPTRILTAAVGPRTVLVTRDRLGRLLTPAATGSLPYRLVLGSPPAPGDSQAPPGWRRAAWSLVVTKTVQLPGGPREVQASVDLLGPAALLVRGALLAVANVLLLFLLWGAARVLADTPSMRPGWRRIARSFRLRVALALALFFVLPTLAFSIWAFSHFANEAVRGRDLLIRQTLRDAAQGAGSILRTPGAPLDASLRGLSERVDADLALYRGGLLVAASSPVLRDLGVVGPVMDAEAFRSVALRGELEVARTGAIPALAERVGYRVIEFGPPTGIGVLVTPQAGGDVDPGRQQRELALVLLLGVSLGIGSAVAGAGFVARALTRPVADLRRAAVALGQGRATPMPQALPPLEFEPVFGAFHRMAADIHASQAALEQARRRTAAVLATVTTGVIAVNAEGNVMIANARARELTGSALQEGQPLGQALGDEWGGVREELSRFVAAPTAAVQGREHTVGERRIVLEMAPLGSGMNGVVVALNDVTEVSRAERVLAWGEMARQVAHEIKNPLTPMRLGIQHLRRVHRDRRGDFDATLTETSERILSEIDRLDTIARAFSRFAAPEEAGVPVERVDLAATAADVVQLYRLTADGTEVELDARTPALGGARRDEVKEVLVNLLENAREAGARRIIVRVRQGELIVSDDGRGIPDDVAARIFEPRFSTTTSGSGLGLAIVKRLVEGWGGSVAVASRPDQGTSVTVTTGAVP